MSKTEPLRFTNPWANDPGFVNLGHHDMFDRQGQVVCYDLYAVVPRFRTTDSTTIRFGARYGEAPHEYSSGEAYRQALTFSWRLAVGGATAIAAGRYFANVHPELLREQREAHQEAHP